MKNPFKDFLYFSRGERRGILVLIIGIVLIFLSGYIYSFRQNSRQLSEEESRIQAAALKEYDNFIGSVREQEKNENSRFKKSERYKKRTVRDMETSINRKTYPKNHMIYFLHKCFCVVWQ